MSLMIINDLHIGTRRSAGATKESNAALEAYCLDRLGHLLQIAAEQGHDVLVNGDLFDKFDVPQHIEVSTFGIFYEWLRRNPQRVLTLSMGNHDYAPDSSRMSSFSALATYLMSTDPRRVRCVDSNQPYYCDPDGWAVIPHRPNQQEFDRSLAALSYGADVRIKFCFVHANLMSPFAVHADHSLNVAEDQLKAFRDAGITLVFGHEHNARQLPCAVVVGNQFPMSVSDCLDSNPTKQYAVLSDGQLTLHDFVTISDVYEEIDWRSETLPDKKFIRVSGTAEYEEAAGVVKKLAEWRKTSNAFVITNAVRIGTLDVSLETGDVRSETFDIWQEIMKHLPEELKVFAEEVKNHE